MTDQAKAEEQIDFADPKYQHRVRKSTELMEGFKILQGIMNGSLSEVGPNEANKKARVDTDPDAVAKDLVGFASRLGKSINDLGVGPIDWKAVIGTEPVDAADLVPLIDQQIPYILKPLIVEGSLTQIQGIPKGGKSAFSLYLSLCLASGIWPAPQYLAAAEPIRTLYLAWEDPDIMMAQRLSLNAVGMGHDRRFSPVPGFLKFLFCPNIFIENIDHEAAFRAAVMELQPKVIFIDTLSHVHAKDENSSTEMKIPMRNLARIAKDLKVGIVYIHHTGKSQKEHAQDKSRGSGAIAAAWHVLVDWGTREKGSNVNPVEIQSKYEHRWKNWNIAYESDHPDCPTWVKWNFEADAGDTKPKAPSGDRKRARLIETFKKLHETAEWVTAVMVLNTCNLGLEIRSVQRQLKDMCVEGILESKAVSSNPKDPLHYRLAPSTGNLTGVDFQ